MSRRELSKRLADITAEQISAYLELSGWRKDGDLGGLASVWHRPEAGAEDAEVLLPSATRRAKDFDSRLIDAVTAIATFESRSPIEIVAEVLGHFSDRIRVRVFHYDVDGGSIPLDDGVLLIKRARDMMEAAAYASMSKRRQFSGRKSEETNTYLKSLRLGQTEVGSYVVNIIAPMPEQQIPQMGLPSVPMTSLVTATLSSGLHALDSAIGSVANGGSKFAFDEAVNNGASANLCDALVGMSGEEKRRGFEVTVFAAGAGRESTQPVTYRFDQEKVERVEQASAYYKGEDYTLYDRTIKGSVEKLDRALTEDRGTITIAATIEGRTKNISVELDKDEYHMAVKAHDDKQIVECHGDVRVTARSARLMNPRGFRVISNGELI